MNAMPPKGMCFDCTDEEYQALIEYMAAPAE
jgi:cytochrome c5